MKRILQVLFLLSTLALATGAGADVIKLGSIAPEGSPWHEILEDMGQEWSELSGGEITLRIYAGGVAGDESDMVRKMRVGQLHAATLSAGGLPDITPEFRALQMPMLFRSYEELDYVRDRIAPELEKLAHDRGFTVLTWGDAGWLHFFTKTPVTTPDDLKPLPLFTWFGNSAFVDAWKTAGFRPIALAATEINAGLQSGLIDAVAVPPLIALSYQWFAQTGHMTRLNWVPLVGAIVVSNDVWEEIEPSLREKLLRAAQDAGRRMRGDVRALSDEAVSVMKDYGLEVHDVPPDVEADWAQAAAEGSEMLVGTLIPAEILDRVIRYRDEFRSQQ
jgi:TRAP-type C4-dicarboxylate transport system substrate-binding protein